MRCHTTLWIAPFFLFSLWRVANLSTIYVLFSQLPITLLSYLAGFSPVTPEDALSVGYFGSNYLPNLPPLHYFARREIYVLFSRPCCTFSAEWQVEIDHGCSSIDKSVNARHSLKLTGFLLAVNLRILVASKSTLLLLLSSLSLSLPLYLARNHRLYNHYCACS